MNALTLAAAGAIGAATGSFVNVVADRLPVGASIVRPASHCPGCQRRLQPLELIPIFSWLALRGRCRTCSRRIPARTLLVEAITGVLFVALFARFEVQLYSLLLSLAVAGLVALTVIDLEHQRIPNRIVFPLIGLAAGLSIVHPQHEAWRLLAGGAIVFALLLALALFLPGGMGMGDVKLGTAIGLLVGYPTVVLVLMMAFITGGASAAALLLTRKLQRKDTIPFAPFLAGAGIVGVLYGEQMVRLWLGAFA